MNTLKKAYVSSKKFVSKHRVALAFGAGASLGIVLNKMAVRSYDDFLKERGLYDEYYFVSDVE